jgi:hypothetical protein
MLPGLLNIHIPAAIEVSVADIKVTFETMNPRPAPTEFAPFIGIVVVIE